MIEIHLLRYALAAADSGSFSQAAGQFGIKQSTLSNRVQYLEQRLGIPLFRRSTRGVVPTDPGERFLRRARGIVQDIDALDQDSRALARGETGTLRLGFHGSLGCGDLAAVLRAYRAAWPAIEIHAREGDSARLLDDLDRGRLDLAVIAGRSRRPTLRSLSFWSEPVMVALPPAHPLAGIETLYWTDLRGASFAVTSADPGPDLRAMIHARLSGPGHRPDVISQDVRRDNLLSLIAPDRIGVSAGATIPSVCGEGPILREIHDAFGATRMDQGVHWRSDTDNPAVTHFLALLSGRYARPVPKS
jgi:DNA-binding transcriptional LysR family regulator